MTESGFSPVCLACAYDLTGLTDGRCPECGGAFAHAGLQERWYRARECAAYPVDRTHVLGTGSVLACACAFVSVMHARYFADGVLPDGFGWFVFWFVGSWALATFWCRAEGRREHSAYVAVGAWVALLAYISWLMPNGLLRATPLVAPVWASAVVGAMIGGSVFATRAETAAVHVLRFCALALVLTGVIIGADGVSEMAVHIHWSRWPDLRVGPRGGQYPLTTREAAVFGAVLVGAELVLVVGVEVVRLGWRRGR